MIVAIGGVSRSGKTRLTKLVKEILGDIDVFTICQDDYVFNISDIPKIRELTDWECPASIDFNTFIKAIQEAKKNYTHVIVEGFLVFQDSVLNKLYDKSIFIEINQEIFTSRRLRDTRWENEPNWYIDYVWESYLNHGRLPNDHNALMLDGTQIISEEQILAYLNQDDS